MTAPYVDPLPQDPQKSQGTRVFNINAKAWTAALALFTDQFNAALEWFNDRVGFAEIVNDPNENYTIEDAHRGEYRRMTSTSEKTVTVNTSAETSSIIWNFRNAGSGNLTVLPGDGVTITPNAGGTLDVPPNGTVSLIRVGLNTYDLTGQTVAAE